jgi:hypothetical protein
MARKNVRTDKEVLRDGNALSRQLYACLGYQVPQGYRFDLATHPQEIACFRMADLAYAHIEGTDLQEAANNVGEEEAP